MQDARKHTRKGFILFTALATALLLLTVFQASFESVSALLKMQRADEVRNQMVCTAKTALFKSIDKGSGITGAFPTGDYTYSVTVSGNEYEITVTHRDRTLKYRAYVYKDPQTNEVVIYKWERIESGSR